jgi:hypothetical protein
LNRPGDRRDHDDSDRPARHRLRHTLPDAEPALFVAGHQHAPERGLQLPDVGEQEEADEEDREQGEEDAEEAARDAEDRRDRIGDGRGDVLRAVLDGLGRARVSEPRELARVAELLNRLRELLQKVAHVGDERYEQHHEERGHRERAADDGHRGGESARHVRVPHHEAHRVLEDEGEEDPDEDDQERVADRDEGGQHGDRGGHQQHRAHRD